jgi:hypothetical protein
VQRAKLAHATDACVKLAIVRSGSQ